MAGRNRAKRRHEMRSPRDFPYPPPAPRGGGGGGGGGGPVPVPVPAYPIVDEIAMRRDECHRIHAENRLMLEEIACLKRDNSVVKDELHFIRESVPKLRADKESESREWIQKVLKLEAELRSLEPVKSETMRLRTELRRNESSKEEISAKIKELKGELKHLQSENEKIPDIKAEIALQHQELARTRTECEYEKKAGAELAEQVQVMQKNLVDMAREAEQLRAELTRRVRGPDYGPYGLPRVERGFSEMYGLNYGPDGDYGGGSWPSSYDPLGRLPLR